MQVNSTIIGKICNLKVLAKEDIQLVRKWRNSDSVSKFFPSNNEISETDQEIWFNRVSKSTTDYYFLIEDKNKTKVGLIFINDLDLKHKNAEFGFYIGEEKFKATGIAMEAEFLLLDFCFNQLNLHKVYCESLAFNKSVITMHPHFGFKKDGIKRQHTLKDGTFHDLVIMSVIHEEFIEAKNKIHQLITRLSS